MNLLNNEDINLKAQKGFLCLQIVTSSTHAVVNTAFVSPDPKPSWFDELNQKLDVAKVNSNKWINDLSPRITASIPSHIISYANDYKATTDVIIDLINSDPKAKGKDNPTVISTFELIDSLSDSIDDILEEVGQMQTDLEGWGKVMQKSHDDLASGATNIQNLQIELQADINKMNSAMDALRAQIKSENDAIAVSAGAIGVGIFVMVVAIALAPETGGASLWVAGGAGAVVIGGAVTWGVMQAKINGQFDEIAKDQQRKSNDERQIVALQGLSMASNSAVSSLASATAALSDVRTMWTMFQNELADTKAKLHKADMEVSAIVNLPKIKAAQKEWDLAVEFAKQLIDAPQTVEAKTLPMSGPKLVA